MMEPRNHLTTKRFQVALSFAGEHRNFVEGVAEQLSRILGQSRIFYDRYYEAELARPNLDTYLMNIYRDDTDLVAIFLCSNYAQKDWCGLEWRVVRDILKRRHDSGIMCFKFDDVMIEGLLSIDGYIDVGSRTPEDVADLILQRINRNKTLADTVIKAEDHTPPTPTSVVKIEVCRRLGSDWQDLADYFNIPTYQRQGFKAGREPQEVWEWLEARSRLPDLAKGLASIGRDDLVEVLQRHPR